MNYFEGIKEDRQWFDRRKNIAYWRKKGQQYTEEF